MSLVPLLDNAISLAQAGCVTGASSRNWTSYGAEVELSPQLDSSAQTLLCDPQTSGGLLVACADEAVAGALDVLRRHGFAQAALVGHMYETEKGRAPRVTVDA